MIDLRQTKSSIIFDIFFWKLSLFYKYNNFECTALHLMSFVIKCNFFLTIWSFYWSRDERMRIDHVSFVLIASDLIRVLTLTRSQSRTYRIDQTIKVSEIVVFVDHYFCLKCFLFVSSMRLLFHWIFRANKWWRS